MTMLPFLICSVFVFACIIMFFLYQWCEEGFAMASLIIFVCIYIPMGHYFELRTTRVWLFFVTLACLFLLATVGLHLCSTANVALLIIGSLVFLTNVLAYTLLLNMDIGVLFFVITPSAHRETAEFYVSLGMQTAGILLFCWVIYRKRTRRKRTVKTTKQTIVI